MRKLVVVGAGALGSHFVQLVRNLEAAIVLVDGDRVESRNALAQFHAKASAGKNKAQALQGLVQYLWGVKIHAVPHMLTGDNAGVLLGGAGLVVDCTDNLGARQLIMEVCAGRPEPIPSLHGALAADGAYGRAVWRERFKPDAADPGVPTCEDGAHLPFVALTASYLARAAQEFLRSRKQVGYEVTLGGAFKTEV